MPGGSSSSSDTVFVAPPTGDRETDRSSVLAALAAVFLEGDDNRVELSSASDSVRDLGRRNAIVDRPEEDERASPPAEAGGAEVGQQPALADAIRDPAVEGMAADSAVPNAPAGASESDTVHVAPPAGDESDRASMVEALERAQPGATVRFAPGTYLVGEVIRIETPRITLLGHPEGTVLRGCDPEEYEANEREVMGAQGVASGNAAARCGVFELTGGEVTVRNLTFENSRLGLLLGCCHTEPRFSLTPGGYLIEGNVFRNSLNGIRPWTTEPSVIRDNEFINTFHAISGVGSHLHVLGNDISVPEPSRVPGVGHPSFAIALGPLPGRAADALGFEENGEGHVISGNRIEGHPDGIYIPVYPDGVFRGNVIRDNTIRVSRVPIPPAGPRPYIVDVTDEADSTIVGIPIGLYARPGFPGAEAGDQEDGWFEDNLIEGNRILGAEGVALALQRGRGNRIVENSISDVVRRDPFPGNTVVSSSELWEAANGSGIWISPDSDGNEIVGDAFENVAGAAVVIEGDRNRVELRSPTDSVHDVGTDNEVSVADGAEGSDVATAERIVGAADTVHVAPPTGDRETDRSSILAALAEVEPGGTIQFAPGTCLIGQFIHVRVSQITLVGHPRGTTLRGCDPDEWADVENPRARCNTLELLGSHQTVRNLTFEYMAAGLALGAAWRRVASLEVGDDAHLIDAITGGHLIEGNTFRESQNGVNGSGKWSEPVVIRDNLFINMYHAIRLAGSHIHLLDNDISAPQPERVPGIGHPGLAVQITGTNRHFDEESGIDCEHNVIAGNRIEGHPQGGLYLWGFGNCRHNSIRDNMIVARSAGLFCDPPREAGVPMALWVEPVGHRFVPEPEDRGAIEENVIEGNHLVGVEGLGIVVYGASRNRIVNNTISGVTRQDPFCGNLLGSGLPGERWRDFNGSGIWLTAGSDGNEIVGNAFEEVAGDAVVLEGDSNRVETRSASDSVRDLGTGNEVVVRAPDAGPAAEHEIHVQSADLTRLIDAAMRATGVVAEDAPPVAAAAAADAIDGLDHAGITYGLVLSGAYFWGSPHLRSPRAVPMLDSLGLDLSVARERVRAENLYVAEQVARYPDRLAGACSANPLADYALEELERCAVDPRITAFSLHLAPAPVDFTDESHMARLRTFFEAVAKTELAVIVHMRNRGEGYGAEDAGVFIREVLAAAPGVPVQIAHMAGWGPYDEATDSAMQAFVDAFEDGTLDPDRFTFGVGVVVEDPEAMDGDTATARRAAERNARLAARMREIGVDRVVFSTDWPFFPPRGDPRTRIAANRALLRKVLPLEPDELDRFFSNVGPVFQASGGQSPSSAPASAADNVHVAAPTGAMESDRASILAALEEARPEGDSDREVRANARRVYRPGRGPVARSNR